MDRKGASLDKKKVRNWAPKFLEKKGAKLDKKGAKSETSHNLRLSKLEMVLLYDERDYATALVHEKGYF